MDASAQAATWLDLYDWRQRVATMYQDRNTAWRNGSDLAAIWHHFRAARDDLFRHHPQSPLSLAARQDFAALEYFPYDPAMRVEADLTPETGAEQPYDAVAPGGLRFRRAARLTFALHGQSVALIVYWIDVYGGGLFVPFRDATCGKASYGGGRYLFDTIKGSDFMRLDDAPTPGYPSGRVVLDFNYAYNPSCAYDDRWLCPLAPNENKLPLAVTAGEQRFHA